MTTFVLPAKLETHNSGWSDSLYVQYMGILLLEETIWLMSWQGKAHRRHVADHRGHPIVCRGAERGLCLKRVTLQVLRVGGRSPGVMELDGGPGSRTH